MARPSAVHSTRHLTPSARAGGRRPGDHRLRVGEPQRAAPAADAWDVRRRQVDEIGCTPSCVALEVLGEVRFAHRGVLASNSGKEASGNLGAAQPADCARAAFRRGRGAMPHILRARFPVLSFGWRCERNSLDLQRLKPFDLGRSNRNALTKRQLLLTRCLTLVSRHDFVKAN